MIALLLYASVRLITLNTAINATASDSFSCPHIILLSYCG